MQNQLFYASITSMNYIIQSAISILIDHIYGKSEKSVFANPKIVCIFANWNLNYNIMAEYTIIIEHDPVTGLYSGQCQQLPEAICKQLGIPPVKFN